MKSHGNYQVESEALDIAARLIQGADGLIITAGAGLGVDSGLPDYRTVNGMYTRESNAPRDEGLTEYDDLGSALLLETHPETAWAFHLWMYRLFQNTAPHAGYSILLDWCKKMPSGYFAFTSNVDGYFERAGFAPDRIFECHGSMHRLQCTRGCEQKLYFTGDALGLLSASDTFEIALLPRCNCGRLLRPNVMMFDDLNWLDDPYQIQYRRMDAWIEQCKVLDKKLVIVELGAGRKISRVRDFGERQKLPLIRVNLEPEITTKDPDVPIVHIQMNALAALEQLQQRVCFD